MSRSVATTGAATALTNAVHPDARRYALLSNTVLESFIR